MLEFLLFLLILSVGGGLGLLAFFQYPAWKRDKQMRKIEKKHNREWEIRNEVDAWTRAAGLLPIEFGHKPGCRHRVGRIPLDREPRRNEAWDHIRDILAPMLAKALEMIGNSGLKDLEGILNPKRWSESPEEKEDREDAAEADRVLREMAAKGERFVPFPGGPASPYGPARFDLHKARREQEANLRANLEPYQESATFEPGDENEVQLGKHGMILDCQIDIDCDSDLDNVYFRVCNGAQSIGHADYFPLANPGEDKAAYELYNRQRVNGLTLQEVQGIEPFLLQSGMPIRIGVNDQREKKDKITFTLTGKAPKKTGEDILRKATKESQWVRENLG